MAVNQKRVEECRITPVKYGRWYQSYKIPKQKTTVKEADEKKQNKWKTTSFFYFFLIFFIFFIFLLSSQLNSKVRNSFSSIQLGSLSNISMILPRIGSFHWFCSRYRDDCPLIWIFDGIYLDSNPNRRRYQLEPLLIWNTP